MNTKNDGGPAFPVPAEPFLEGPQGLQPASAWGMEPKPGMTLRDWFAGQVIATTMDEFSVFIDGGQNASFWAYKVADAMLAERSKP